MYAIRSYYARSSRPVIHPAVTSRCGLAGGIGYLNDKHMHAWDFADQPLPYQAFLGDQYLDDGVV